MLTISLKPGEYVDIGDDIRFIFTGGTMKNIHVLIEAPKDLSVERTEAPPEMRIPLKRLRKKRKDSPKNSLEEKIEEIFGGID